MRDSYRELKPLHFFLRTFEDLICNTKTALEVKRISDSKATINISEDQFEGLKDIMPRINYEGDIGYSFIN